MQISISVDNFEFLKKLMSSCIEKSKDGFILDSEQDEFKVISSSAKEEMNYAVARCLDTLDHEQVMALIIWMMAVKTISLDDLTKIIVHHRAFKKGGRGEDEK